MIYYFDKKKLWKCWHMCFLLEIYPLPNSMLHILPVVLCGSFMVFRLAVTNVFSSLAGVQEL